MARSFDPIQSQLLVMANPQSLLAALADSQELLPLGINPRGDSGDQPSRPEHPSGATEMSTADSVSEEAGASSLPIIPPESTGVHILPH